MIKFFVFKLILFLFSLFLVNPVFATLDPPNIVSPTLADSPLYAGEIKLEWKTDVKANFYQYHINLEDIGESEEAITTSFSKNIYTLEPGNYSWAVRSCGDSECKIHGTWSNEPAEKFEVIWAPAGLTKKGLVACGRKYDSPDTPGINDAEPCGFKHIFLLLKNILDFLLWRAGPIILGLLIIVTGVMFYFSMGKAETLFRVRSLLKSAFVGYLLIFFAWLITNWILGVLGFQVDIFGRWWMVNF